jgi:hypothetical protein
MSEKDFSARSPASPGRLFVQVGAGAGDRDPRAKFRDGFTELIKSVGVSGADRLVLVEPNPLNIDGLRQCWKGFNNIEIFQLGICPRALSGSQLPFYYAEADGPHFQVASFNANHVLKHYPSLSKSDLRVIYVETADLLSFLSSIANGFKIVLLALDIEGIDADVILDTDFSLIDVELISFEHLHLRERAHEVASHFYRCGFEYVGRGVDHKGYDHLYRRRTL